MPRPELPGKKGRWWDKPAPSKHQQALERKSWERAHSRALLTALHLTKVTAPCVSPSAVTEVNFNGARILISLLRPCCMLASIGVNFKVRLDETTSLEQYDPIVFCSRCKCRYLPDEGTGIFYPTHSRVD